MSLDLTMELNIFLRNLTSFYEDTGVEHQLTTPYSPQQNGTTERKK